MENIFDPRSCKLGEGPLWHPIRKQLFWFDILSKKLMSRVEGKPVDWVFDEYVSAAGWTGRDTLLLASDTGLWQFELDTGECSHVVDIEADQPLTRSNDGRADPWGGFWIGTMGIQAEPDLGSIYRYYKGELRKIVDAVTISNSISFSPDKSTAYFTDTPTRKIMQIALDGHDGWPTGGPEVFADLTREKLNPDGSVVDSTGCLWNAQWGAGRVAQYGPDGRFIEAHKIPAAQATCPAFGGTDMKTVFVTSAADGLEGAPDGLTFQFSAKVSGQEEHRVVL
ncbi:SMP-30/gluconolactonase/LRE family protein [Sulfitobacter donghicola]|uniref:Gluconolactonase n=1 Tax=Sulfitobacter donghicola DSW-25 = KCTC 12864 = JCM 14565 TaxID=1300350 RepID=A0A073IF09_9RHOB|nr:SMP-30/gluconolactonase/LRE family protein [Sulfitobacter donghicola]KEJ88948.1 gluconolactonase [Sulfitobacter donghicola DSW-25 = KCTC 12864 = JCM 14565]KIN67506.1 Smp-30/Cgr1 family protein [Sulfitobacter donghicola DSW-25 = KCTC 12864 = JCM 14565]